MRAARAKRREGRPNGLYFYKVRYYDPELGRFLQTDPIGYADQMNLYAYVGNDPVNATDPTGRQGSSIQDNGLQGGDANTYTVYVSGDHAPRRDADGTAWYTEERIVRFQDPDGEWVCCRKEQYLVPGVSPETSAVLEHATIILGNAWVGRLGAAMAPPVQSLRGIGRRFGAAERATSNGGKIGKQMANRGWTQEGIDDAIANPTRTVATRDTRHLPGGGRMDDPATAYYGKDGGYIVRNDRTGVSGASAPPV